MNPRFAIFLAIATLEWAAARGQGPKFDAAAIRLCSNSGGGGGDSKQGKDGGGNPFAEFSFSPGRLNTGCRPLATTDGTAGLIPRVYGRLGLAHIVPLGSALRISGGPAWVYSDDYEIKAIAPGNTSEELMEGPMLQALLEDRFKLKIHRESKDVPLYALTVAKGGIKLKPLTGGNCVAMDFVNGPPPLQPGQRYCDTRIGRRGANTTVDSAGATLAEFCRALSLVMDRPLVDKTGIAGKFDIHMEFAIDQAAPGVAAPLPGRDGALPSAPPDALPAPSVFTAVQQEWG